MFVNRSLSSAKHVSKGKQVALKKYYPMRSEGSIFLATLAHTAATHHASAPTHSACRRQSISLPSNHNPNTNPYHLLLNRSVWCSSWRGCLFCCTQSLNPHPWLLLPPSKPQYRIRYAHTFFMKGATATHCFCSPAGRSG